MRIALAQINPVLCDFNKNKEIILEFTKRAKEKKADLVVFPEASLFGYHPFDLLEQTNLVQEQTKILHKLLKEIPKDILILIGGFEKNKSKLGRPYYNSVFLCEQNRIIKTFRKELLPTGDVFDEARFIEKGSLKDNFFKIKNKRFFLSICEDIWAWEDSKGFSSYTENPIKKVKKLKLDLVINMSASPFFLDKLAKREHVVSKTAQYFKSPMLYVNMVGAQDEIIYDGQSFLVDKKGNTLFRSRAFEEDLNVFDLESFSDWNADSQKMKKVAGKNTTSDLRKALVLGLKDFCTKVGLTKVHLGISGGVDSALVACLAVDALGPNNVKLLAMPTEFNSELSLELARKLAQNLRVEMLEVSIQKPFENFKSLVDANFNIQKFGLIHENLQSRLRGVLLMAYSNQHQSLLLNTSNKSEFATGYSTLYGDMCGGLSVIGDLTKKQVYEICKLYNKEYEVIPKLILSREPSAELRPNQKDQDSLPEYAVLDKAVENIVERGNAAKNKTEKWLLSMLMKTEFKRWQAPPVLKVTEHAFGRGRRFPIAHKAFNK